MTASAAALIAQWLFAQAAERAPFPPYSFGDWFIRQAPGPLATEAIERLGPLARDSLVLAAAGFLLLVGAAAGTVRPILAPVAVVGATLLGAWLAPVPSPPALVLVTAALGAGSAALFVAMGHAVGGVQPVSSRRRGLLLGALSAGFLLLAGVAIGVRLRRQEDRGLVAAKPLDASPTLRFATISGLSPLITPPGDHYVVDINIQRPRIAVDDWQLRVAGLAAAPKSFRFVDLLAFELTERAVVLQCISNWPAGRLVGNASWSCFPLDRLLDAVQPLDGAAMVLVRAYDGYFESFPLAESGSWLVAVGMGGRELTGDHGFPVRLLYPGHYGMQSVKWVTDIELVADDPGSYWSDRGWDRDAPMRTGSRIESPPRGREATSPLTVAGTAYGAHPITAVDVSFDDGASWEAAELEPLVDEFAWTRWRLTSSRPAGRVEIRARAWIGDEQQDAAAREPHPSGATGLDLKVLDILP